MADIGYDRLRKENIKVRCSVCGGPLKGIRSGEYECLDCGAIELDDFGKIRQFLDACGPQSKEVIMAETGVSREVVNQYIKEQRLIAAGHGNTKCVLCGAPIETRTLCLACAGKPGKGSGHAVGSSDLTGRMRFDRRNRET